jgi:hypothetical protein
MSAAAPLKAIDLFPRDSEEAFRTGEVLKHEFQLIHGTAAWKRPETGSRRTVAMGLYK